MHVFFAMDHAHTVANEGQFLLNVLVGFVLPMLVAVVTHRLAADWLKSVVLTALTVLSSLLTTVTVASFHWKDFATAFVLQFGTAVAGHFGLLKPTGVTGSNGLIQKMLSAGVGAGTQDVSATVGPGGKV